MFGMFSICAVGRTLFDNNYCGAKNCTLQATSYIHTTYGFIHVDRTRERGIDLVW